MKLSESDIARFWSKVDIRSEDECWPWKASHNIKGYGWFRINNQMLGSHRVAFAISKEDAGPDIVMHTCDNPPCCNPKYLTKGSDQSNAWDRAVKHRGKKDFISITSTKNYQASLTADQVRLIRLQHTQGLTQEQIARLNWVNRSVVKRILNRESYKDIL